MAKRLQTNYRNMVLLLFFLHPHLEPSQIISYRIHFTQKKIVWTPNIVNLKDSKGHLYSFQTILNIFKI
jgi:hypothetical protein